MTAEDIIKKLDLKPLPSEGGFYRETYRSDLSALPARMFGIDADTTRNASTAILYLVVPESFSALHKVKSDEIFLFHGGDPAEMIQIDENGKLERFTLGNDLLADHTPQVVVRRGVWQGLRLKRGGQWSLMSTIVAPGFEFEDFEIGLREPLIKQFPQHLEDITNYTTEAVK